MILAAAVSLVLPLSDARAVEESFRAFLQGSPALTVEYRVEGLPLASGLASARLSLRRPDRVAFSLSAPGLTLEYRRYGRWYRETWREGRLFAMGATRSPRLWPEGRLTPALTAAFLHPVARETFTGWSGPDARYEDLGESREDGRVVRRLRSRSTLSGMQWTLTGSFDREGRLWTLIDERVSPLGSSRVTYRVSAYRAEGPAPDEVAVENPPDGFRDIGPPPDLFAGIGAPFPREGWMPAGSTTPVDLRARYGATKMLIAVTREGCLKERDTLPWAIRAREIASRSSGVAFLEIRLGQGAPERPWDVYLDRDARLEEEIGLSETPFLILVDSFGRIAGAWLGVPRSDGRGWERDVEAALAEAR